MQLQPLQPINPVVTPAPIQPSTLPREADYSQMSLDDLLREVDLLRKPSSLSAGSMIEPLPTTSTVGAPNEEQKLLLPTKEYVKQP